MIRDNIAKDRKIIATNFLRVRADVGPCHSFLRCVDIEKMFRIFAIEYRISAPKELISALGMF